MIVAEFLFVAFVVGVLTGTWAGFLGTFLGLYVLYRFTRLSAVLALALSGYWGLLGYHLGVSTGQFAFGPVLAVVGFVAGAWVHRGGFAAGASVAEHVEPPAGEPHMAVEFDPPAEGSRRWAGDAEGEIVDAEYRVVS